MLFQVGIVLLLVAFVAPNFVYMFLLQFQRSRYRSMRLKGLSKNQGFYYASVHDDASDNCNSYEQPSDMAWQPLDKHSLRRRMHTDD